MKKLGPDSHLELVEIWAAAVKATHDFLSLEDFEFFHSRIASDYLPTVELYGAFFTRGEVPDKCLGFMGLARNPEDNALHIEMLFIDPAWHRQGIGKAMMDHAKGMSQKLMLDVNEQNGGALGFYLKQGFAVIGRSERDPGGKPYPLLHLMYVAPE